MPTISVIIPAYNAERTILETIESVRQQTFSDFELVIINDGSTDKTLALVSAINDPRLRVVSYENGGLSVARNRGIANVSGNFIAFLDADDLWTPDKLELQLEALQRQPSAGVAYSWTLNMSEDGQVFHPGAFVHFEGNVLPDLLVSNFIANGSNPLIRRQAIDSIGEFDPSVPPSADWDYWLRLAAKWAFVVVPKPQILYRHSSSSMSARIELMEKHNLAVLDRAFQMAPAELQYLKNKSLSNIYQYLAGMALANVSSSGQLRLAGLKLMQSVYFYPMVLLDKRTLRYFLKWLLMSLLSPKQARTITSSFGKASSVVDPRVGSS
jgi:glycosyltransferase involved in cell wall biosynthesis